MSIYLEKVNGEVELIKPDYSEGELLKVVEELKAANTVAPVINNLKGVDDGPNS